MCLDALVQLALWTAHPGTLVLHDELSGIFIRQIQEFVAHLHRLGALGKEFLLRSGHWYFLLRKFFDTLIQVFTILTYVEENHSLQIELVAADARVDGPWTFLTLLLFDPTHNLAT